MKTATEYDVPKTTQTDIEIKCPYCGVADTAVDAEWERSVCRCWHCDNDFKLLPLEQVLKQAKEKRKTYVCTSPTPEEAKRMEEVMDRHVSKIEPGHAPVSHPKHYTGHPSGVECIQITEHMNFCRGNAMKYIWRAGEKGNEIEDLKKARWYIDREIQRLEGGAK